MAKKTLKCAKCDRTFSMPAHLARHRSAIHGAKKGRKSAKRKAARTKAKLGRRKRVTKRVGRPATRTALRRRAPIGDVSARLLGEMRAYHSELVAQRTSLDAQLDAITSAMQAMGAAPSQRSVVRLRKRGRPAGKAVGARAGSLKDYIVRVLRQRSTPMSPHDIGTSVVKAGLKTKAKDITKAVSNTLPEMKNVKRVGFGKYKIAGRAI